MDPSDSQPRENHGENLDSNAPIAETPHRTPNMALPAPRPTPKELRHIPDEELAFLREYTGDSLEACRARVVKIWESATKSLHVYRCVAELMFLATRVSRHPFYQRALEIVKQDTTARYLEAGCAFGTDVRRLILDGWPAEQIWALDVHDGYWKYGLELYGDGPDAEDGKQLKAHAVFGNILKDEFFSPVPNPSVPEPLPRDSFSVISLAAVLHVLAREDSVGLLTRLHDHFIKPGGFIFGSCVGTNVEEGEEWWETPDGTGRKRFLFSEGALKRLMESIGYTDVSVKAYTRAELAGLESRAPRVVEGREAEELAKVQTYLVFSGMKKAG